MSCKTCTTVAAPISICF